MLVTIAVASLHAPACPSMTSACDSPGLSQSRSARSPGQQSAEVGYLMSRALVP